MNNINSFSEYCKLLEGKFSYPTLRWVKSKVKNNIIIPLDDDILEAYVIGSYSSDSQDEDSDLDIALIVRKPNISGKAITEDYHSRFKNDIFKPKWKGLTIDFKFFNKEEFKVENSIRIR